MRTDDRRLIDQVDKCGFVAIFGARRRFCKSAERALDWHKSAWVGCELSISGSGIVKFADGDSITSDNLGGSSFKLMRQ